MPLRLHIVAESEADETPDDPPSGTIRGAVRLNVEQPGNPGVPQSPPVFSNKWLMVGDDFPPNGYGEKLQPADLSVIQASVEQHLADRGLTLDDYLSNRTFSANLAVPQSFLDSYTGT